MMYFGIIRSFLHLPDGCFCGTPFAHFRDHINEPVELSREKYQHRMVF